MVGYVNSQDVTFSELKECFYIAMAMKFIYHPRILDGLKDDAEISSSTQTTCSNISVVCASS